MPHLMLKDLPRYECLLEASREFPDLDPSAAGAYLHLLHTADLVAGRADANLSAHGISHGRFGVLMLLWRASRPQSEGEPAPDSRCCGPRTPAELAESAGVTRATMTGLIDTLERDGYVRRDPDPSDRRMLLVSLTAKGEDLLHTILPKHLREISAIMQALTESERKSLVSLLAKIQSRAALLAPCAPVATAVAG